MNVQNFRYINFWQLLTLRLPGKRVLYYCYWSHNRICQKYVILFPMALKNSVLSLFLFVALQRPFSSIRGISIYTVILDSCTLYYNSCICFILQSIPAEFKILYKHLFTLIIFFSFSTLINSLQDNASYFLERSFQVQVLVILCKPNASNIRSVIILTSLASWKYSFSQFPKNTCRVSNVKCHENQTRCPMGSCWN